MQTHVVWRWTSSRREPRQPDQQDEKSTSASRGQVTKERILRCLRHEVQVDDDCYDDTSRGKHASRRRCRRWVALGIADRSAGTPSSGTWKYLCAHFPCLSFDSDSPPFQCLDEGTNFISVVASKYVVHLDLVASQAAAMSTTSLAAHGNEARILLFRSISRKINAATPCVIVGETCRGRVVKKANLQGAPTWVLRSTGVQGS